MCVCDDGWWSDWSLCLWERACGGNGDGDVPVPKWAPFPKTLFVCSSDVRFGLSPITGPKHITIEILNMIQSQTYKAHVTSLSINAGIIVVVLYLCIYTYTPAPDNAHSNAYRNIVPRKPKLCTFVTSLRFGWDLASEFTYRLFACVCMTQTNVYISFEAWLPGCSRRGMDRQSDTFTEWM